MKIIKNLTRVIAIIFIIQFLIIKFPTQSLGGSVKKTTLLSKLIELEEKGNWTMLSLTIKRENEIPIPKFKIYFISQSKNEKLVDIDLFNPEQWIKQRVINSALSPDGSLIAFSLVETSDDNSNSYSICLLSLVNHKVTELIPPGNFLKISDLCWLPNAEGIFFIAEKTTGQQSLFFIDLNNNSIKEIIKNAYSLTSQACSPDSKIIAYTSYDNYIFLYNMDTGLSNKLTCGIHPSWSPKGNLLLYSDTPKEEKYYTIQPDGKNKSLLIYNNPINRFKLFGEIIGYITGKMLWSPDGDYIYFERSAANSIFDTAEYSIPYVMDFANNKDVRLPKNTGTIFSWVAINTKKNSE